MSQFTNAADFHGRLFAVLSLACGLSVYTSAAVVRAWRPTISFHRLLTRCAKLAAELTSDIG